ncbi:hypothetical protein FE257_005399 [Aspergillus nanangensis]|uniref:Hydrophobin n=1 Tax=Aspergillus nanangensis TaxID=2582783 RepID=A0AAD4CR11_ASPNN|nr:hypothetical protein FE257_005399 [Aspergillus nanangensis]
MKFTTAALMGFVIAATAIPQDGKYAGLTKVQDPDRPIYPAQNGVTVKQASKKCGDGAQLSCCNKVAYSGDSTDVTEGPLANLLSGLGGGQGSGARGVGLFDQCSKLPVNIDILLLLGINDALNQECKQNVVCCQGNGASSDGDLLGLNLPCVALGSVI